MSAASSGARSGVRQPLAQGAVRPDQIKAIHVLKGQAGLSDADYRDHLRAKFRVFSSKQLSEAQAGALLDDLRGLSGKKAPKPSSRPAASTAGGQYAAILRALWLASYSLGIVREADDSALLAFVKRQCKVDHDRFLTDGAEAAKAIEALKAMISREGGVTFATPAVAERFGVSVKTMNKRLVISAIAAKIRASGADGFDAESFACLEGFPAVRQCGDAQLDRLAARMGAVLRGRIAK